MKILQTIVLVLSLIFAQTVYGKSYNIQDFGAVADGVTLNTKAIQQAIDKANKKGGGKVIIPSGKFLTGSIQLKSNVELYLEEGAFLLGSTSPYDYFKVKGEGTPESPKTDDNSELGLILAIDASNIKITGQGTIDGQGLALALNGDSLHHAGVLVDKNYNYRRMRPSELVRPKLFRFLQSNNIEIKDVTLTNSANWGLSFDLCKNMILDHLTIINRAYWNNDGMDITDCKNVKITNCNIDAADDGICLKSYHPESCNDSIYIANCTVRSSASAVKFGTGSFGGFKNVTIENIKVFDTFRSAIAIESVDGAVIENIKVKNIVAKNTGNAIFIRLGHRGGEKPGIVRNIHISDMQVEVPFGRPDIDYDLRGPEVDFFHNPFPSSIAGIPGHEIENVTIENVTITFPGRATKGMAYVPLSDLDRVPEQIKKYPEFSMFGELPAWGFYVRHVKGLEFKNIILKLEDKDFRPAFVFDDVEKLDVQNTKLENCGSQAQFALKNVLDYNIDYPVEKITIVK
ncbi:glycoside hydrolase family 28 protein [Plebeiibacterium marinum]|uniref:Glycoside hydrolase family 28 protein n=1 Tax=Plebeiibacterium marinum TaxID=2992111 RepID=A0AAE3MBB1_9BACT|nr:glycoside hydrolase family 28 protein [Plebeiobacterium marinum]MCW3804738.1 glycoside hydrolase family 28 protein [Plebeiobacterium marinum]